jgi:WD40 repeat protein
MKSPTPYKRNLNRSAAAAWLLIMLAALVPSALAQNGAPSREPTLRVETGMHIASIMRIGVDAAGRYIVTSSHDKTLRVWELQTGRMIRIIRPPIGAGNEGKLYAVTLSPDGTTIAAGGWTGYEWDGHHTIYLFDRESGRLLRRIGGLPNVIDHLTYSRDGRYLVATLGRNNGVRVYAASNYALVGEDTDYGSDTYGADFDAANRLVTISYDGFIRLYDVSHGSLQLMMKQKAVGGERPFDAKFSPDGTKIAVGFTDAAFVNVFSARDLSPLYAPDVSNIPSGDVSKMAWSPDGSLLYGGGSYPLSDDSRIRIWSNGGRGTYQDVPASVSTIMQILPLRDGSIAYGSADPAFGMLDPSHRRTVFVSPAIADFRGMTGRFLLSADGAAIQFGYEPGNGSLVRFSLTDRQLEPATGGAASSMRAPVQEAAGVNITGWRDTDQPKLDGKRLPIDDYETSRSIAFTPDKQRFVLGTEYRVRLFDRTGKEVWSAETPGVAWAVNVSTDGRYAVAAFADGTIRWYAMSDGKELLALFPHNDRKRWVMWTPSGYYDASTGAEDLIGWHVNNGAEQAADFFPVSQFRNVYYRPDVVSRVLQTGNVQLALSQANDFAGRSTQQTNIANLLPPIVELVTPSEVNTQTHEIVLRYTLRAPSGEPVTDVRVLVDGRPVGGERGIGLRPGTQVGATNEVRIPVPDGDSQVSLIAANRFSTSVPATVRVRAPRVAAPAPGQPAGGDATGFEIKPKLYVLAIGVGTYANAAFKLGYPAKDARDFAAALVRQKGGLYRDVTVRVLTDEQATRDEVVDAFDWIQKETTAKDVAIVLLAGHGVNDANGQYYFLPYNADIDKLRRTGVNWSEIRSAVTAIPGKVLFFVDTCHSGNVLGGATRRGIMDDMTGPINELSSAENGAVVFAASTGKQYSLEKEEWNNGAFTKAVVEGLDGRADYSGRGRITVNMLDLYISERVKELTRGSQTPTTAKPSTVPDFPVALKRQ